jgi:O-antigen/teichoic acid export membrane protein
MNIQDIKNIFKNTAWLGIGEVVSRLFLLFLFIYAARILGPQGFGIFNFALAIVSFFVIFSNLGISDITTRELAKDSEKIKHYPGILLLRILLSIGAFIIIFIVSFFLTQDEYIRKIIWILGIYVLTHNFLIVVYSFFRARRQMKYEALIRISEAFLAAVLGFLILSQSPSAMSLSYAFLSASLFVALFSIFFFSAIIRPVWISWDFNLWKNFLKVSWPIGIAYAFGMVYIRIDSVMMGFLGQITEVGWYSAAYKIAGALIVPSSLIGASFFPVLSKLFNESKEKFQETFKFYIKLMIILAIAVAIIGLIFSSYIINLFYGQMFSPAVLALQILIIMSALNYIYGPFYLILIAANKQKKVFQISFIGALINIVLNIILIPYYSLYGAAIATSITYIVLVVLAIYHSRPILFLNKAKKQ